MMIEYLLRNRFPNEYGLAPEKIYVPICIKTGTFSLTDRKACTSCHQSPQRSGHSVCNEETLRIDVVNNKVTIIDYETYIGQFVKTKAEVKERCDYLLADETSSHRKIVFCDLTCVEEKWLQPNNGNAYPEGKRAKARQQMLASIKTLLTENLLATTILTFTEKVCLLGWRDRNVPTVPANPARGNVMQNMQAFITTPSNMAAYTTSQCEIIGYGFVFTLVKYPNAYKW